MTQFSRLVRRAEQGEEIVVRRGNEPVARLGPLKKEKRRITGRGSMKGEIWMVADEEMKQVDEEIERLFEESEIFPGEGLRPGRT